MPLLMLLGNGFEEIEALGTLDLLRRGEIEVTTCTINRTPLTLGAHGIAVEAECCLTELDSSLYDGVILPGGLEGTQALAATQGVTELLRDYDVQGKLICAICAAPAVVLAPAGILRGRSVTGFPAPPFIKALGEQYVGGRIREDGNLITAEGPGRFTDFARAILTRLRGSEVTQRVFAEALVD